MATQTPNYGLTKPAGTEVPDIAVINGNMDKIDAGMKANADNIGLLPRVGLTIDNASSGKYAASGSSFYYTKAGIVFMHIRLSVTASSPSLITLFDSVPAPVEGFYWAIPADFSTSARAIGISVTTAGTVYVRNGTDGNTYYGTISYPMA